MSSNITSSFSSVLLALTSADHAANSGCILEAGAAGVATAATGAAAATAGASTAAAGAATAVAGGATAAGAATASVAAVTATGAAVVAELRVRLLLSPRLAHRQPLQGQ